MIVFLLRSTVSFFLCLFVSSLLYGQDSWTNISPLHSSLIGRQGSGANGFVYNNKIYFGYGNITTGLASDLWVWNGPNGNNWSLQMTGGTGTLNSTFFTTPNYVYSYGGVQSANNSAIEYDLITLTESSFTVNAFNTYRVGGVSFSIGNYAYTGMGIGTGTSYIAQDDLWRFDEVNHTWTQMASIPQVRSSAVAFTIGNKGYVSTGCKANFYTGHTVQWPGGSPYVVPASDLLNDFWEYTPNGAGGTWVQKADYPGAVRRHAIALTYCNSAIIGTGEGANGIEYDDMWEWNQVLDTWIPKKKAPHPMKEAFAGSINSNGYIIINSEFWKYTPTDLTTGGIVPTSICSGISLNIPYWASCLNVQSNNIFTVELSDANGSFANPVVIGTLSSVQAMGTISTLIPLNTPNGTGYRIRVVASAPYTVGADNGVNITINQTVSATVGPFSDVLITDPSFQLTGATPPGGTYNGWGMDVSGNFYPSSGLGSHTITYSVNGGCGTATTTINVVCPTGSLASFTNLTLSSAPLVLTGGLPTGGVYSGPGVSNGTFNPAVAGIGTHTITYTPYPGCPAVTNSITVTEPSCSNVFINPYHSVFGLTGPIYNFSPPHVKTAPFVLTGGFPLGGVYSGPGVSNGIFDPAVAGNGIHTITYTYGNCPPVSTTITVLECEQQTTGGIGDEAQGDVVLDPELYCESSIQVDDLSPKIFCAGENRILQFTQAMENYYPTIYRAYLMDASGTNVVSGVIGTYTATNSPTSGAFAFPIQIPLGTPAGTYKIRIDGSFGSYNYNGIPSSYTITVGPACTENSEVTDIQLEASAICSSENLKFSFTTTEFQNHSPYTIQLSNPNGSFSSTAVTYYLGSIYSTGLTTNVTMPIPNVPVGSNYKIRVIGPSGVSTVLSSTFSIGVISCTALEYDGINDVSTITGQAVYNRGSGDFTMEAWVKMSSSQSSLTPTIMSRGSAAAGHGFDWTIINGGTQMSMRFTTAWTAISPIFTSIYDDQCHHIAVVRVGTSLVFYLDGVAYASSGVSLNKGISGASYMYIGNNVNNENPYKGEIHEIRFWNLARTLSQLQNEKAVISSSTGLIGYWRFKELGGQVLIDASANANNAGWLGTNNTIEDTDPVRISTTCHSNDRLGDVNEEDNENDLHSGLRVYPNPFEESFTILALSEEGAWMDVEIVDIQGHQVYQGKLETDTAHKLVLPIPNGMYIVVATCGDRVYRYKVMKSN